MDTLSILVAILAGALNAYGLENIPYWSSLPPAVKKVVVAAMAVTMPILLDFARSYCGPDAACGPAFEANIGQAVIDGVIAWVVSQFAHGFNPLRRK